MRINHLVFCGFSTQSRGREYIIYPNPQTLDEFGYRDGVARPIEGKDNLMGDFSPNCETVVLSRVDRKVQFLRPVPCGSKRAGKFHVTCPPNYHFHIIRNEQRQRFKCIQEVTHNKRNRSGPITDPCAQHCAFEWPPRVLHLRLLSRPVDKGMPQSTAHPKTSPRLHF